LGGIVKKTLVAVLGLSLALALCFAVGCTAGPNLFKNTAGPGGAAAGFWLGLWHGFILPFAFIASLFNAKVGIYEVHNTGTWYNLGFLMGTAMIWGSGGGASARRR
jgi:hypothetical protein